MYTVSQESVYLLVQGVPQLGVIDDLLQRCALYGAVDEYRVLHEYPAADFTEVVWVKFQRLAAARCVCPTVHVAPVLLFRFQSVDFSRRPSPWLWCCSILWIINQFKYINLSIQRRHLTNFDLYPFILPSSRRPCAETFKMVSHEPIMQSVIDRFGWLVVKIVPIPNTTSQYSARVFKRAGRQFSKMAISVRRSMIKKALTTVVSTFYQHFDDYFCNSQSLVWQQLIHLLYNRLQVNVKLLLFFGEKIFFFVCEPKKGRVLILKYEKGRVPKKKGRGKHPAKSA